MPLRWHAVALKAKHLLLAKKEKKEKIGKKGKLEQESNILPAAARWEAPMQDNVFSPSFGNRPSHLVGRSGVIAGFLRGLGSISGSRERAVLLLGQRGSGKTVLLWEFADRARKAGFVVANPTVVGEGMLDRIVEKIQDDGSRYVKDAGPKLVGGSVGALGFSAGLEFSRDIQESKTPQFKLTQLCRRLTEQGHGVLILVDEVQANVPELRQLVIVYQELVGQGLNVAIAMAGLPGAVAATLNDHVLTFLNRARKVQLGPLATSEVDAYYARAFPEIGLEVPDGIRRAAAEATKGSPYMLQLVGYDLALYAGEGPVDERVLERALDAAREDFENDVCRTTLAALSDRDIDFLCALARQGDMASMGEISQVMGVSSDYAQKYRRRLIDSGVIESPRRGEVAFAVPYLADYLRREE